MSGGGARAPCLVLAWGNDARGDDALGPLLAQQVQAALDEGRVRPCEPVEVMQVHQLQVEQAMDLAGRRRVLFVDAAAAGPAPFDARPLGPAPARPVFSHALSPEALLQVHRTLAIGPPPECTLLAIRGQAFELGAPPGAAAHAHLDAALAWALGWLAGAR